MQLTIVIPALNEEEAIASTIERTLAARSEIINTSPVTDVEIIVVSDGSTDRTPEIARGYDEVKLIEFPHNRGYGAAIKAGFEAGGGELVSFLDADGTCDPRFFATLCSELCRQNAAIALGSRLGPTSRMPRLRRLGNRIFAGILSLLSNEVVRDTASGMRVIRRSALERLYPLPDGLHFTPAMSARALLDERLPIVEIPMHYEERIGESKLNPFHDGIRFLNVILSMVLFCRPARLLLSTAVVCFLATVIWAAHPIEMWLTLGRLEESMIYRLLFCSFVGSVGMLSLSALAISEGLRALDPIAAPRATLFQRLTQGLFGKYGLTAATAIVVPALAWLIGPGLWTWLTEGHVPAHWSRVVLAGLLSFGWCQIATTRVILAIVAMHVARQAYVRGADKAPHAEAIAPDGAADPALDAAGKAPAFPSPLTF